MAEDTEPFASASVVRDANRPLLDQLADFDQDSLPQEFLEQIEHFRYRAAATGQILCSVEDRAEVQTAINFWTTVLFTSANRPRSLLLLPFDSDAARARAGDAPPYKGLDPFQIEDNSKFFGRHKAVAEMLDRLSRSRLLAVLGLSGSGKSSVVRAGLIPRLREGAVEGSAEWRILDPVVPGTEPLKALAEVARQLDPSFGELTQAAELSAALDRAGRRVLVSIDQFEELFTLEPSEDERRLFLEAITLAVTQAEHEHIVLLTMRSEFDTKVRKYDAFDALFEAGRVQIAALSPQELRSAIEQPAAQVGVTFEPGLADELVQAVVGEPAGLPLLQFTLLELWKLRSAQNQLTWDAYKRLGGSPRDILAQRAGEVYSSFRLQEDRDLSQRIFLALVRIGAGLEATSHRIHRSELDERVERGRDNINRVLGVWRENGLIRISPPGEVEPDSQVEVAHEALIRNWSLLVQWTEDAFASTRRRRVLTELAREWQKKPDRTDLLLGEISLRDTAQLNDLNEEERAYVDASREEVDREGRRLRLLKRVGVLGAALGILLLLVAAGAITIAAQKTQEAFTNEKSFQEKSTELTQAQRAAQSTAQAASERYALLRRRAEMQLGKASRELDRLRSARTSAEAALASARSAFVATMDRRARMQQAAQLAQDRLAEIQRLYNAARTASEDALEAARQAGVVAGQAEQQAAQARGRLEEAVAAGSQIFAMINRPALQLQSGVLEAIPDGWRQLRNNRATAERVARSVGRIQMPDSGPHPYAGTAFMVGDDVAITMGFVVQRGSNVENMSIDFRDQPTEDGRYAFRVESVIGEIAVPGTRNSLVLLRVAKMNEAGEALPPPLGLSPVNTERWDRSPRRMPSAVVLYPQMLVYVVGYPSVDTRSPAFFNDMILGGREGVKRVQPGALLRFDNANGGLELAYDSTTFGGNAGSPVVDLRSGLVIGIHHSGRFGDARFGTAFTAAILGSPMARSAGIVARTGRGR